MPALPADIAAASRAARIETRVDAAMKARYPNARDGSATPATGFFDLAANAVTALAQRAALIGGERRRFKVTVEGLHWPSPEAGMPTVMLIDPEQGVADAALVSRIELDANSEQTIYEVMA